jgi:hypothetical protein
MSDTTEASKNEGTPARSGRSRAIKRYGPFVGALILVIGAVALFGRGKDDDKKDKENQSVKAVDNAALIKAGPMTPERAELEGKSDVDFGPNCDAKTGRIKLPTVLAPPCVQPFTGDNGGATSPGVTKKDILIVAYNTDPKLDPLAASIVSGGGANIDPKKTQAALTNYVKLYNKIFETYGRKVTLKFVSGSGASSDVDAAKADAIKIADMKPFAVIGGPAQATKPFATELAARGVICGPACTIAEPDSIIKDNYPYIWEPGPTPDEAAALGVEMISKLAGPGKAAMAGDDATKAKDRVYAIVHYDTPDGDHQEDYELLRDGLKSHGITEKTDVPFLLDLAKSQENARTIITKLKKAGVTTVIYTGDPFTPGPLTHEATRQDYHPEWILGPSVLGDSTFFARMMDGDQWKNGFGMSVLAGRADPDTNDSVKIYRWAFGEKPPANTVNVTEPGIRFVFTGIQMAGPKLTPQTFRDALFRLPTRGGGPTIPQVSWGKHNVWSGLDYGSIDDMTLIWWDPKVSGDDEIGNKGPGMYRYADHAKRYKLGHLPDSLEAAKVFDDASSETIFKQQPPDDVGPTYPKPNL